jgi:hypothetical protein
LFEAGEVIFEAEEVIGEVSPRILLERRAVKKRGKG